MTSILSHYAVPLGVLVNAAVLAASVFWLHWEPEQVAAAQGVALAVMGLLTYQSVASAATVARVATEAATKTAQHLVGGEAGLPGQVTEAATAVVDTVVENVVGGVGGLVGTLAGPVVRHGDQG